MQCLIAVTPFHASVDVPLRLRDDRRSNTGVSRLPLVARRPQCLRIPISRSPHVTDDTKLQADVLVELRWELGADAAHVGVAAHGGAIALTGHVPTYLAQRRSVTAAARVHGVRVVADDLEVRLADTEVHGDAMVAEAISHNLQWNEAVPRTVQVKVTDGWVTLSGGVDSYYQRDAAAHAVAFQTGVRGVANLIEVARSSPPDDVHELIELAFERSAELDAEHIQVTADGDGTVRLRGTVRTMNEALTAREAAYAAPGVYKVESYLEVTPA
ncbi:MAG: osmY [Thermoleophilia bacterium]|nr:osmY [Thermoleophilia bacterium]